MRVRSPITAVVLLLAVGAAAGLLFLFVPADPDTPKSDAETPRADSSEPNAGSPQTSGGPEPAPTPEAAPLSGVVRDAGGSCVEGAAVLVFPLDEDLWVLNPENPPAARAATDAAGLFSVPEIAPGRYYVEARLDDARGFLPIVSLLSDEPRTVEVRLLEIAEISGRVLAEDLGPVAGAIVSTDVGGVLRHFYEEAELPVPPLRERIEARTDAAGRFRLAALPEGRYDVEIASPTHSRQVRRIIDAPVDGIDLVLTGSRTARVLLVGAGEPWVRLRSEPPLVDLLLDFRPKTVEKDGAIEQIRRHVWRPRRDRHGVEAEVELRGLTEGRYRLLATAPGRAESSAELLVEPGAESTPIELVLDRGSLLTGQVTSSGRRVPGATVVLYRVRRTLSGQRLVEKARATTGRKGFYSANVAQGEWVVRPVGQTSARTEEWIGPGEAFVVPGGVRTTRNVEIRGRRVLVLRVSWPNGWPVRGLSAVIAPLVWEESHSFFPGTVTSPAPGTCHLRNFSWADRYQVVVGVTDPGHPEAFSHETVIRDVSFGDERVCTLDVTMPTGEVGTVRGRVIDEQSRPVAGAVVLFNDGFAVTGADGRFTRGDVNAGEQRLSFLALGRSVSRSGSFRVKNGEVTELRDLVLPRSAVVIRGLVTDSAGVPVPGAQVKALFPDLGRTYETIANVKGEYEIRGPGGAREPAGVGATAPGYAAAALKVRVLPTPERGDLTIRKTGAIEFRLSPSNPRDLARPGVSYKMVPTRYTFWLRPRGESRWRRVEAGRTGTGYRIAEVPPGDYELAVCIREYFDRVSGDVPVVVPEGGTTDLGSVELEKR